MNTFSIAVKPSEKCYFLKGRISLSSRKENTPFFGGKHAQLSLDYGTNHLDVLKMFAVAETPSDMATTLMERWGK